MALKLIVLVHAFPVHKSKPGLEGTMINKKNESFLIKRSSRKSFQVSLR